MKFFEYPYVIITILASMVLVMAFVGLYFTMKSVRTSKETSKKNFCAIGKTENEYKRTVCERKNCNVVYATVSLDTVKRLLSESKALDVYENVKHIMLCNLCSEYDGSISLYGKDGFVVVNGFGQEEINRLIDKCFNEINDVFFKYEVVGVVSVNFGLYATGSDDVTFETALLRAKQACSIAEESNTLFCRWDIVSAKAFEKKLKIENSIRSEIDNNRFFLEYQPIIDAETGKIVGAEVLSRLNSESDGVLTPGAFLSAVNSVGINDKFDYYIFEKNCKWIANDKERREKYVFTINFSRQTLCNEGLAEDIIRIVEKYGIDFSCIAVEILEDKELTDEKTAVMSKNLVCLKQKGMLILLDDFGKGFSGFGDLAQLDISIVKIDKSITQNSVTESGFLILKNIINTAHGLGFRTLCEGVETEMQKDMVIKAGCDMLQGYYFYRPMPVLQLETLFEKQ